MRRCGLLGLFVCVGSAAVLVTGCGDGAEASATGSTSSGGSTGSAGSTSNAPSGGLETDPASTGEGSSTGEAPYPYNGEPFDVPEDGDWHFVEIDGMACNGGVQSGVGVRRVAGSKKLVLYFKGGGACFNATTCGFTAPLMETGREAMDANPTGVLDFGREENPLLDYNIIYFPYCTGDVHAGVSGEQTLEGAEDSWNFVGHDNVLAGLDRIAPTFPDPEQLVVLGTSAGGLGAMINFPHIRAGWPETETLMIDDSGLVLPDAYLNPCLQTHLRDTWGISDVLPKACEECSGADGGGLSGLFRHMPDTYPDVRFSVIASNRDQVLRLFYGFGNDDCASAIGVPDLGAERYTEALEALRTEALDGRFTQFIIEDEHHTWSTQPVFWNAESGGVRMQDWFADVLEGTAENVQPQE